jgi:hypothetical protein
MDAEQEIAEFSEQIFGLDVDSDHVIGETHYSLGFTESGQLPDTVEITDTDISHFDGSADEATKLAEKTHEALTK